mmetsp:Transcript_20246/g.51118  ORF Transcript_20246/g.51118 Transcript_20246/m.51118 type:complete len:468 (-) Transcript_20246:1370-2773(-)
MFGDARVRAAGLGRIQLRHLVDPEQARDGRKRLVRVFQRCALHDVPRHWAAARVGWRIPSQGQLLVGRSQHRGSARRVGSARAHARQFRRPHARTRARVRLQLEIVVPSRRAPPQRVERDGRLPLAVPHQVVVDVEEKSRDRDLRDRSDESQRDTRLRREGHGQFAHPVHDPRPRVADPRRFRYPRGHEGRLRRVQDRPRAHPVLGVHAVRVELRRDDVELVVPVPVHQKPVGVLLIPRVRKARQIGPGQPVVLRPLDAVGVDRAATVVARSVPPEEHIRPRRLERGRHRLAGAKRFRSRLHDQRNVRRIAQASGVHAIHHKQVVGAPLRGLVRDFQNRRAVEAVPNQSSGLHAVEKIVAQRERRRERKALLNSRSQARRRENRARQIRGIQCCSCRIPIRISIFVIAREHVLVHVDLVSRNFCVPLLGTVRRAPLYPDLLWGLVHDRVQLHFFPARRPHPLARHGR